ncbi:MAG: NAD-dependent epimerase/dehydratase family protein [Spirochaetes bacterium]|nr:NAD-dependent epimerase/dehydratase family protein [Spirochaetota bacterium]
MARALLSRGFRVRALARRAPRVDPADPLSACEWVAGSLTDPARLASACAGTQAVFHCAAQVAFHPVETAACHAANVEGTRLLLEAASAGGVARFVHCSTVAAIGLPETGGVADEETPYNWPEKRLENLYSRTKRQADLLVRRAVSDKRIDAVLIHPGTMVGPNDPKPSSGRLVLEVARGKVPLSPAGINTFVDVRSVAAGMLLALEKGRAGEGYILSGENLSYLEFFGRIARLAGVKPPRGILPRWAAMLGGFGADLGSKVLGRDLGLGRATVRVAYIHHAYSSAKAIRELGYASAPLEGAIADALADFKRRGLY